MGPPSGLPHLPEGALGSEGEQAVQACRALSWWGKNTGVCFKCEWPTAGLSEGAAIHGLPSGVKNFSSCHGENRDASFFLGDRVGGTAPTHF